MRPLPDRNDGDSVISAIRFGGYPEMVHAMSDAIYGGATVEAVQNTKTRQLKVWSKASINRGAWKCFIVLLLQSLLRPPIPLEPEITLLPGGTYDIVIPDSTHTPAGSPLHI